MDADDLAAVSLPAGLALVRTSPMFDASSMPPGLARAHRIATGVWGLLRVSTGSVRFVDEASGATRTVAAGDHQVIAPDVLHHVEPDPGATFSIEFHQ